MVFFVVVVKVIFRKFILQAKVALFISNFNYHHFIIVFVCLII